jgi:hypothetical protein
MSADRSLALKIAIDPDCACGPISSAACTKFSGDETPPTPKPVISRAPTVIHMLRRTHQMHQNKFSDPVILIFNL